MDLRVDDGALRELVAKSIVDNLTPEAREKLISNAVTALLTTPTTTNYGRQEASPLQRAFNDAVHAEAHRYASMTLKEDEQFKIKIKELFADAMAKLFADETRDELVDSLASLIRRALTKDRY